MKVNMIGFKKFSVSMTYDYIISTVIDLLLRNQFKIFNPVVKTEKQIR